MSALGTALRLLLSRWVLSLIVVTQIIIVLWVFGPSLPGLEPAWARLLASGLLLLAWFIVNWLISRRRQRRDTLLAAGAAQPVDSSAEAQQEERAKLAERLEAALSVLRKARGRRGYLYEQPWYIIIGPPGAGKTTALLNAGLRFPLASEFGAEPLKGVGGTRRCDWWFTDEAVLIDTAGRYLTQDSDPEVDRAGWTVFLDLLKRTRPRRPINGVIVGISIEDLAMSSAGERREHARKVRARIRELQEQLGLKVPVYLVLTKADLIAGFTEFFADLDQDRRNQVWGSTFPLGGNEASPVRLFPERFHELVARLDERLLERVQAERSPERRALIAVFPAQVATLEQPLAEFLAEAFGGSRLDPAPALRGFYFTSGTQEGAPFDRLTGMLSRSFGLDQRQLPSVAPGQGRSYFVHRLLRDVIFREAMLASARPGQARRQWAMRLGAYAGAGLVFAAGTLLLLGTSGAAEQDARETEAAFEQYRIIAQPLPLDPVADADFDRVLPLLNAARSLPHGEQAGDGNGLFSRIGLGQGGKLGSAARQLYSHTLARVLLPRLVWRLEAQMRAHLTRPDLLYEATRVYLMLGGIGPMDRALVHAWMARDWELQYPGPSAAPRRAELLGHLDALLSRPLPEIGLDGALIAQAQSTFTRVPISARAYSRIRGSRDAQLVPPWKPADALGAAGVDLFQRGPGKSLADGVPGFYTVEGFHRVLLHELPGAATEVASESWVLGRQEAVVPAGPQLRALEREVIGLYTAEYIQQWEAMLADLKLSPLNTLNQATKVLYILGSPQSPMRDLLTSITRQLTLSVPPPQTAAAGGGVVQAVQGAADAAATRAAERVNGVMGGAPSPAAAEPPPGAAVDEHFKPLRDAVGSGAGSPFERVLPPINALQQQLLRLAGAATGAAPAPSPDDPVAALRAEAARQPQPIANWLQAMAAEGAGLRGASSRQQVALAYNAVGGPAALCLKAAAGRFPFVPGAKEEIPMDDFTRLFAAGGMLDKFFNEQLRPYVDTSSTPWRMQEVAGVPPPIQPRDLEQFRKAADIRDVFFAGGGAPAVRFDITPEQVDGANTVNLELGLDQPIRYSSGPPSTTSVTWPGSTRMLRVRVTFEPPPSTGSPVLQETGPWALFRLFRDGKVERRPASEQYVVTWRLGDREASFEMRAGSVQNPLVPGLLQGFQCPAIQ